MSATYSAFGAAGRKSRSTRSVASSTPGIRIVVRQRLRGLIPAIPAAFIKRATRLRPTPTPCSSAARHGPEVRRRPAGVMDLLDLLGQPGVAQGPVGRRPPLPVMKAGAVDADHAAHHGDGKVRLLRGDERERLAYRPSLSFGKKTAAFA